MNTRRWLLSAGLCFVAAPLWAEDKKAEPVKAEPSKADAKSFASPTDAINFYIREGYARAKIAAPAARATDDEFLRRAFIDLIGRVATVAEVLDFEQDSSPNKRAKLVQRLLNGVENKNTSERYYTPRVNGQLVKLDKQDTELYNYPDQYGVHWANVWTVWLMTRSGNHTYRDNMQAWLEEQFISKNTNHKDMVVGLLTATGKSNKNGAVNFIIHHLGEATPADKRMEMGPFDAVPITSRVTRLFLGIQTNCTQCHDHPFNKEWVQADFWGVNAYFRQTTRDVTPTGGAERRMTEPVFVTLSDDAKYNNEQIIFYERRDGKLMASKPNFLKDLATAESGDANHKPLPKEGTKSRREALAEYVTSHDNFAKAYVNRLWGHFFGRGLNKEPGIDDFGSHNEVIHPEMLDYLAKEFIRYNYDQKKLMEWICCSEVYSLSHVANPAYVDPKYDAYFARMPLKALSPEVLYSTLKTVKAVQEEEAGNSNRDLRNRNRQKFIDKLVQNFGDDEGNEMTFNGTVVQALLMMNGTELNAEVIRKNANNPVNKIISKHSSGGKINSTAVIDELFLAALNRHPTSTETAKVNKIMTSSTTIAGETPAAGSKTDAPKTTTTPAKNGGAGTGRKAQTPANPPVPTGPRTVPPSGPNDATFYQDLYWALLNTNEFMLNH